MIRIHLSDQVIYEFSGNDKDFALDKAFEMWEQRIPITTIEEVEDDEND